MINGAVQSKLKQTGSYAFDLKNNQIFVLKSSPFDEIYLPVTIRKFNIFEGFFKQ